MSGSGVSAPVHAYHDGTKHHFHRFARSLGYLDWASQPNPFRSFAGAPEVPLSPRPDAPVTIVGDVLRHALGLSAWKQFGASRWSLRVNPSSGNLHPTEAYVIAGAAPGLGDAPGVYHYAPDRHALERRCSVRPRRMAGRRRGAGQLAGRADVDSLARGVEVRRARVPLLPARHGACDRGDPDRRGDRRSRRATLLPDWSHADIAALTGIDRDEDFVEAEREEPGCIIVVRRSAFDVRRAPFEVRRSALLAAVARRAVDGEGESAERGSHRRGRSSTRLPRPRAIPAATLPPILPILPIQSPDLPDPAYHPIQR